MAESLQTLAARSVMTAFWSAKKEIEYEVKQKIVLQKEQVLKEKERVLKKLEEEEKEILQKRMGELLESQEAAHLADLENLSSCESCNGFYEHGKDDPQCSTEGCEMHLCCPCEDRKMITTKFFNDLRDEFVDMIEEQTDTGHHLERQLPGRLLDLQSFFL
mmetsp:Transcript_23485/g.35533  ORF Transcript_23485/g.35533 Transcript_23485/m.35533 type:complete len:161 (-) Transcript_23485:558-1040(-)